MESEKSFSLACFTVSLTRTDYCGSKHTNEKSVATQHL